MVFTLSAGLLALLLRRCPHEGCGQESMCRCQGSSPGSFFLLILSSCSSKRTCASRDLEREGTLAAPVEVHVDPSEESDYCRQCRITHRPCCPNALPSNPLQQLPHCECLDTASVTKVQIE
ncbi:hypothetical protein HPB49_024855 [Dermacentor silvarum]|uniref:Uncharacterized protein n=1 Tax=Dermacentor silvarum TaxID=543639 RepID=A0ACB8DS28_DERSI|nr:hypothetical protein HPB49_024855 [Dermacentor silvarum]